MKRIMEIAETVLQVATILTVTVALALAWYLMFQVYTVLKETPLIEMMIN